MQAVTGTVVIPRGEDAKPVVLKVRGLPLGTEEKLRRFFPTPKAPDKWYPDPRKKQPKSGPPIFARDPDSGALLFKPDEQDEDFRIARAASERRTAAFLLYNGLDVPSVPGLNVDTVAFDAKPPQSDEISAWEQFGDAVWAELQAAGWQTGDVALVTSKILELSNLDKKKVEAAASDFLASQR